MNQPHPCLSFIQMQHTIAIRYGRVLGSRGEPLDKYHLFICSSIIQSQKNGPPVGGQQCWPAWKKQQKTRTCMPNSRRHAFVTNFSTPRKWAFLSFLAWSSQVSSSRLHNSWHPEGSCCTCVLLDLPSPALAHWYVQRAALGELTPSDKPPDWLAMQVTSKCYFQCLKASPYSFSYEAAIVSGQGSQIFCPAICR